MEKLWQRKDLVGEVEEGRKEEEEELLPEEICRERREGRNEGRGGGRVEKWVV